MTDFSFLFWAPLVSAAIWFALSAYLVYHQRYRTWTELFFIGLCALTGGYALSDAIFFRTSRVNDLPIAASASLSCLTLGSTFLVLYGMSLYGRFRRTLFLLFVPTGFFIVMFPSQMFKGFLSLNGPLPTAGPPYVPEYNQTWYLAWLGLIGVFWAIGLIQVTRTFFAVRRLTPKLARRIAAILIGFTVTFLAGFASNGLLGLSDGAGSPPLFSAFLAIPGSLIFLATTPSASRRLNDALLRRKAAQYDVKAAFLTFSDGTVIGSKVQPEENMIDADSFSATLDVISNFMRTSFPTLRGKWLKSIRHGEYTLVMERGRHAYLTLVLGGQENDQLRRQIIEGLTQFEENNWDALVNWRGMAKDARGVDDLLASLLAAT
jgi:hypothetical protein